MRKLDKKFIVKMFALSIPHLAVAMGVSEVFDKEPLWGVSVGCAVSGIGLAVFILLFLFFIEQDNDFSREMKGSDSSSTLGTLVKAFFAFFFIDVIFAIPIAILIGIGCGIFLLVERIFG